MERRKSEMKQDARLTSGHHGENKKVRGQPTPWKLTLNLMKLLKQAQASCVRVSASSGCSQALDIPTCSTQMPGVSFERLSMI